jgi:hypothetical protein
MSFPQRGQPDDGLRVVLAVAPDGIELVEPTFLNPDDALTVLVGLPLATVPSARVRAVAS